MGSDKALLRLPDGRTACAALLETARQFAAHVMLLVDTEGHAAQLLDGLAPPLPEVLLDEMPHAGPLGALAGALRAAPESALLLLAVDMPLARTSVLEELYRQFRERRSDGITIVAPLIDGTAQPMPACYDTRLAGEAANLLRGGRRDLRALLEAPGVAVHWLREAELRAMDSDLRSFSGANTPEEWERLRAKAERADPAARPARHGRSG